jgi:hypothetical protein
MKSKSKQTSLTNADITTTRNVTRRAALAVIGMGVGSTVGLGTMSRQAHAGDIAMCDRDRSDGRGRPSGNQTRYCDSD